MKKIIALILVLCMSLGMVVSVSAAPASAFSRSLNLVRLIRSMFSKDDNAPAYGELEDGILTVYVAANGKSDGTGTEKKPFATIEAARDAIRTLDKSEFDGITVLVKAGTYTITEPVVLTEEDSGTKDCPITYLGEDGAVIVGGVALTADDFSPATGSAVQYFPAEAKDRIVQIDLTTLGFTKQQVNGWLSSENYRERIAFLSVDGERQTIARYPNEDWIYIEGGENIDHNGELVPASEFSNSTRLDYYLIEYGDEHFDRVMSWKSGTRVFVRARWHFLWCPDETFVREFDTTTDKMKVEFGGGYSAENGGIFYWYNIPEELDIPGEYYVDKDAILYYYPGEGFDTATVTLPVSNGFVTLNGTSNITLENLEFTSSLGDGISGGNVSNINILDCEISSVKDDGITLDGTNYDLTVQGNHIHDIGSDAITIDSGDINTISAGNTRVYNNYIHGWSITGAYGYGITVSGVDILVDHNTLHDANFKGIHVGTGVNVTVEYNHVFDIMNIADDVGAISGDGGKENANVQLQYNYVHDIGPKDITKSILEINPDFSCYPASAFYYDGASSYFTTRGNVVAAIFGNGILTNAGRHNYIYGNLFIDCANTYINASDYGYGDSFGDDGKYEEASSTTLDSWVYLDAFKEINPEPAQLLTSVDPETTDPDDPMVWKTPAFSKIQNNWCHFNRGIRNYSNWGIVPYWIDASVWRYSNAEDIDVPAGSVHTTNDHVSVYNSRREAVDLKELITETAAGVIEITWEQFEQIGIVAEDWNHDVEIPEKPVYFDKGYESK